MTDAARAALKDALERYKNCRDDRPLVHTMVPGDPLTVGDLRKAFAAPRAPGLSREAVVSEISKHVQSSGLLCGQIADAILSLTRDHDGAGS